MKIHSNIEYNITRIREDLEVKYREMSKAGRYIHSILIHPDTYFDILGSDEYQSQIPRPSTRQELFFWKVTLDETVRRGTYEFLTREG